jgi:D-glycero-D-manno-heptose 1,7-bisphosphate phosphatase
VAPKADRAAVFLDRDGVLNEDKGYVHKLEDLRILPGVVDALKDLKLRGFLLIVISNQSGVARGLFGQAEVEAFNDHLRTELVRLGAPPLDDVFYCPHGPNDGCACRKPQAGMVLDAARRHGIDLALSWLVGDKADDVACALAAGVRAIQVMTKKEPQARRRTWHRSRKPRRTSSRRLAGGLLLLLLFLLLQEDFDAGPAAFAVAPARAGAGLAVDVGDRLATFHRLQDAPEVDALADAHHLGKHPDAFFLLGVHFGHGSILVPRHE